MVDYVGGGGVAAGTAEPLAASQASDNGTWVVNTAVSGYEIKSQQLQSSPARLMTSLRASMWW